MIPWNGAAIAIQLLTYFSNTYRRKITLFRKGATTLKIAQLRMMLNMANLNQRSKIHEEVLTSLCREMKHFTSNPPIEWVMRLIFFPPEAVYTDSSFLENLSRVSDSLKKSVVSTRRR